MAKLCLGCMQNKESSPICEHCGFDEHQENLSHQLPIGTMLQNQYLVGKVLGQGGFGITYIGWDQNLSIPVAIKEYFPNGIVQRHTRLSSRVTCSNGDSPDIFYKHRERFLKEARSLAQLSDIPEIVHILSYFTENDTAYIVMEFVEGITLKDHLEQLGRPMTESEVMSVMKPVLEALQKVHAHNLIHRDISPDNIMLPKNGGIKLIDFGTVRYIDDSGKSKSTETVLKGGFAPIEQYNTHGNLGTWTDVYALCATFHYLLTGKRPEEAPARLDSDQKLELLRSRPDLSSDLIGILEKGLKVRIADRIQTVTELHQLLYPSADIPLADADSKNKHRTRRNSPFRKCLSLIAILVIVLLSSLFMKKNAKDESVDTSNVPETTQQTTASPDPDIPQEAPHSMNEVEIRYNEALALAQNGQYAKAAIAFGKLGNYRDAQVQSFAMWEQIADRQVFSIQPYFCIGLRNDGTVLATGRNLHGECNVSDWNEIIAVASTNNHTVGLRSDGTVVATGSNVYGQCDVEDWTNIVAIQTGQAYRSNPDEDTTNLTYTYTLGLKTDGTVVATGSNLEGQCNVSQWTDVVYLTTGTCNWDGVFGSQTVALREDGTVLVAGTGSDSWCDVSAWKDIVSVSTSGAHLVGLKADGTVLAVGNPQESWGLNPKRYDVSGWHDIIAVKTFALHTMGLKSDGTLVATGNNDSYNQLNVSRWNDIIDFTTDHHTVGLHPDGTLSVVGSNDYGQCNIRNWHNIVAIYSTHTHTVGIRADGTAIAVGYNQYGQCDLDGWTDLMVPKKT